MRFFSITCLLSFVLATVKGQPGSEVTIGKVDSINSQVLKEQRKFWVHLPPSARNGKHPKKKFPVIYVLDGDVNFASVVGMCDFLSTAYDNAFVPETIVVGILNTSRFRDLTPTHVISGLWVDSAKGRGSGGGDAFMAFIRKELMPHIDSLYPAGRYRMMIGHSLGGLMAINTLVHDREMFNSYIAIDPSMWWDDQRLLHEIAQNPGPASYKGRALFLGMAHTQEPGMDTTRVQEDRTEGTLHARGILELSRYIRSLRQEGLESSFQYYDEESHASSPLMATYDGLHFIFKDYQLILEDNFLSDPAFPMASFLKEHYERITRKYGITAEDGGILLPPEDLVYNQGYFAMSKQAYDKAEALFKMNIKNYPGSFKTYGFLGDLYAAKGDFANAVMNYSKSLSIRETDETRKKLEKLNRK